MDAQSPGPRAEADEGPRDRADAIILDEELRIRIRKLLEEPARVSPWSKLAKHPLTSLFLGFLLTWGVGTLLTNKWERARAESQERAERARLAYAARLSVLGEFFGILFEHTAQAFLVETALARDAPAAELAGPIHAERELFAKTHARMSLVYFNLRSLLEQKPYERIVRAMDNGMYLPLQEIDQIHSSAYEDKLLARHPPTATPSDLQRAATLSTHVLECTLAISDAIWALTLSAHDSALSGGQSRTEGARMEKACEQRL